MNALGSLIAAATCNNRQLINSTPISIHLNQAGHSIKDILLIPWPLESFATAVTQSEGPVVGR